jgi:hypothetical protein
MMIIDGLPFSKPLDETLHQLKNFSAKHGLRLWFSVKTHRHEEPDVKGIPPQLMGREDLFDIIIQLQPQGGAINVQAIKGGAPAAKSTLLKLDPSTMLIQTKL